VSGGAGGTSGLESPDGAYRIRVDNNGIELNGGANGIVRINSSGV